MEQIHSALHTRLSDTSHVGDVKVLLPKEWYIKNPPSHIAQLAISFNCICQMCCFKLKPETNVYVLSHEAVVNYQQSIFLAWMRTTVADIVARLKCGFDLPTTLLKPSGPLHPEKQQGNSDQADAQSSSSFTKLAGGYPYKVHTTCGLVCTACLTFCITGTRAEQGNSEAGDKCKPLMLRQQSSHFCIGRESTKVCYPSPSWTSWTIYSMLLSLASLVLSLTSLLKIASS